MIRIARVALLWRRLMPSPTVFAPGKGNLMSEVISSFFGRKTNDADAPGVASTSTHADTPATEDTAAAAATPAEHAGETVDSTDEAAAEATAEDAATDEATTDEATAEDAASEEAATEETPASDDSTEEATTEETAEARPAAGSRGSTTVGDGVVTKLVTLVAGKAEGVHGLDGVTVAVEGGAATITVALVIEFGHTVGKVAEAIRVAVIDAVERYLGLDVAAVDVEVTDIHLPEA